jgi:heavy metal efflux system protein
MKEGGAYIDKGPNAFFIRSEGLVKNIEEIKKIVIKTEGGVPVLLRDVAEVRFGNGPRYGAATRNGEGETVTGIVMMLKGANSSEVITNVKEKIAEIQKGLPEGVEIEPFLDRKKLVDGAISTVSTNLIEGALIVIFVLILFLGNLRGGLVVASVIPLAMLFAIAMMRVFGVSGNLMSLGAIDFGIIVDGTVIIVEAVLHRITGSKERYGGVAKLTQDQMDEEVYQSSRKIRSAAAFGEGLEYKVNMLKYGQMKYEWITDKGELYFDFHGEVKNNSNYFESYTIAYSNNMVGSLVAPFEGPQGWYFKNNSNENITVKIKMKGQYLLKQ